MNVKQAPMSLDDLQRRLPTDNRWEHLNQMYSECSQMFGELATYPQTFRTLKDVVTPEEEKQLTRILKNIETDARQMKVELDKIHGMHCDTSGQPKTGIIYDDVNGDDLFAFTGIAAQYRTWMDNFQGVTMQPAMDFTQITDQINLRRKQEAAVTKPN